MIENISSLVISQHGMTRTCILVNHSNTAIKVTEHILVGHSRKSSSVCLQNVCNQNNSITVADQSMGNAVVDQFLQYILSRMRVSHMRSISN